MSDKRSDAPGDDHGSLLAPGTTGTRPGLGKEEEFVEQAIVETEVVPGAILPKEDIGRSPWQIFWRQFRRDRWALAGIGIIVVMITLAIIAPLAVSWTGHDPNFVNLEALDSFGLPGAPEWWPCPEGAADAPLVIEGGQVQPQSQGCFAVPGYLLGVDSTGRDLFVRILYGARTSLIIAVAATGISLIIGTILGVISGFFRGKTDTFISRLTDVVLSLPILLLALGLASACGATAEGCLGGLIKPGLLLVSLIIGLFSWPYISRIIRGQVLSLREKEFVEASRSLGTTNWRIMAREILPNVAAPLIVYTTLIIPANILFEAGLSFLGVGVPDTTPSWGAMLSQSASAFQYAVWLMIFPGIALFMTTLAFNLVGDGLRDALDPRTQA
ncbi:MAG TPA: ABC transporter permease [Actinomycetota bacterium]|nr:ABC transporter permease [Actinomycetota bacterium]